MFVLDVDFGADDVPTLARAKRYVEGIQLGWPTVGVSRRKSVVRAVCQQHEPLAALMAKVMESSSPTANNQFTIHLCQRFDDVWNELPLRGTGAA